MLLNTEGGGGRNLFCRADRPGPVPPPPPRRDRPGVIHAPSLRQVFFLIFVLLESVPGDVQEMQEVLDGPSGEPAEDEHEAIIAGGEEDAGDDEHAGGDEGGDEEDDALDGDQGAKEFRPEGGWWCRWTFDTGDLARAEEAIEADVFGCGVGGVGAEVLTLEDVGIFGFTDVAGADGLFFGGFREEGAMFRVGYVHSFKSTEYPIRWTWPAQSDA